VLQVVGGKLIGGEAPAGAATQLQQQLIDDALIDAPIGWLGFTYTPLAVLPEAGEMFEVQCADEPITT